MTTPSPARQAALSAMYTKHVASRECGLITKSRSELSAMIAEAYDLGAAWMNEQCAKVADEEAASEAAWLIEYRTEEKELFAACAEGGRNAALDIANVIRALNAGSEP